jgi:serine protease Do
MRYTNVQLSKIFFIILTLMFICCSTLIPHMALAGDSEASPSSNILTLLGNAMADVSDKVKPAIVNISTSKTVKTPRLPFDDPIFKRFFGEGQPQNRKVFSLGSGVIFSSDGYIVTCNHVIQGAEDIVVKLNDAREFKGKIVGLDSRTDIAIIKIMAENLPMITWGDSDRLRTGDVVIAIGNPYGLNQTVTMGIVSATGRAGMGLADYEDFIQTDASINPGNSGGALVNSNGALIGINDAIFSTSGGNQGIGFAIPSNMAKNVMDSIISQGKVVRGYLGVQAQPLSADLAKQFGLNDEKGVLVVDVTEGSPADKVGLKRGDVIVGFDGKNVENPFHLKNQVAETQPGRTVEIKIIRDTKPMNLLVTITELPAAPAETGTQKIDNALKGVIVQDLNADILRQLGIKREIQGVVVLGVDENSRALGIVKKGDIIMEINRKAVQNTAVYIDIASKIPMKDDILLLVMRDGSALYISLSGQ